MKVFNMGYVIGLVFLISSFSAYGITEKELIAKVNKVYADVFPQGKNLFVMPFDKNKLNLWNSLIGEVGVYVTNNAKQDQALLNALNTIFKVNNDIVYSFNIFNQLLADKTKTRANIISWAEELFDEVLSKDKDNLYDSVEKPLNSNNSSAKVILMHVKGVLGNIINQMELGVDILRGEAFPIVIGTLGEYKTLEQEIDNVYNYVFFVNRDFNIFKQPSYFSAGSNPSKEYAYWANMLAHVVTYVEKNASGETVPSAISGKKEQLPLKEHFLMAICFNAANVISSTIQRSYTGNLTPAQRRQFLIANDSRLVEQKKIIAESKALLEKHLADISGKTLILNKDKKMNTCKILIKLLSMFDRAINKIKADADSFVRGQ